MAAAEVGAGPKDGNPQPQSWQPPAPSRQQAKVSSRRLSQPVCRAEKGRAPRAPSSPPSATGRRHRFCWSAGSRHHPAPGRLCRAARGPPAKGPRLLSWASAAENPSSRPRRGRPFLSVEPPHRCCSREAAARTGGRSLREEGSHGFTAFVREGIRGREHGAREGLAADSAVTPSIQPRRQGARFVQSCVTPRPPPPPRDAHRPVPLANPVFAFPVGPSAFMGKPWSRGRATTTAAHGKPGGVRAQNCHTHGHGRSSTARTAQYCTAGASRAVPPPGPGSPHPPGPAPKSRRCRPAAAIPPRSQRKPSAPIPAAAPAPRVPKAPRPTHLRGPARPYGAAPRPGADSWFAFACPGPAPFPPTASSAFAAARLDSIDTRIYEAVRKQQPRPRTQPCPELRGALPQPYRGKRLLPESTHGLPRSPSAAALLGTDGQAPGERMKHVALPLSTLFSPCLHQ